MADILNDPIKLAMLIILIVLEVPAIICFAVMVAKCRKAAKDAEEREVEDGK